MNGPLDIHHLDGKYWKSLRPIQSHTFVIPGLEARREDSLPLALSD